MTLSHALKREYDLPMFENTVISLFDVSIWSQVGEAMGARKNCVMRIFTVCTHHQISEE
jgi:hypothetical protein